MKVAMIARSTLFSVPGGDTVQVQQTARHLQQLGVDAQVLLSRDDICYADYDLLHFFNIIRPADIMRHQSTSGKPSVISTVLVDYSEFDRKHRKGLLGKVFNYFSSDAIEYLKSIARFTLRKDHLCSFDYLWKGQRKSIRQVLNTTSLVLPNSSSEYQRLVQRYGNGVPSMVVPNGINPTLFNDDGRTKEDNLVICAARIEGNKNQLNLIRALNNTHFKLILIGAHAPNQAAYYKQCRKEAAANIEFVSHLTQPQLADYYQRAKVHVLPSWFETTGLSSLEAAVMGCNVVITAKGDTRDYFESDAFYCDPGRPESILSAVDQAAKSSFNQNLRQRILNQFTWQHAAAQTLRAYQTVIS